jgi:nucleotide-binding universal stress UspA family protein
MFSKIFVPVDNSEYSNAAGHLALVLAKAFGASVVGSHVYAAKMHDMRFKQMEFTLPEEYRDENELERQRKIHDSLITMGLQLISDSYLDVLKNQALKMGIPFEAKMEDGKNWEVLVKDAQENQYDLVVMGALGLGAVKDSQIGSVTERFVRRVKTDVLVVRHTSPFEETPGSIVVGIDGSPQAFGGLKTALALGKALNRNVEAVAVYDPYMHYSMFNSIVGVLSEKAAKVFKFKEQEKLHEEIIDTGLAKIYQSHLEVAKAVAKEEGVDLKITLLDGKAYEKLLQFVRKQKPWLLVLGRIGYHSSSDMDIGSNTENLLRLAPCNVLISSRTYVPPIEAKAEAAVEWTEEAKRKISHIPEFVRGLATSAILRFATERGHSVISASVVDEAIGHLMPKRDSKVIEKAAAVLAVEKLDIYICKHCGYAAKEKKPVVCPVCKGDSSQFEMLDREAMLEKMLSEGEVSEEESFDGAKLKWTHDAWKEIQRIPNGHMRRRAKAKVEKMARLRKLDAIGMELVLPVVEEMLDEIAQTGLSVGPVSGNGDPQKPKKPVWTDEAAERLERIPAGFMRTLTKDRIEKTALERNEEKITLPLVEEVVGAAREVMESGIQAFMTQKGIQDKEEVLKAFSQTHGAPTWKESAQLKLLEIQNKAAESKKFDPNRALELAKHLAEERAKEKGKEAIDETFLEQLGKRIGYGHPTSELTYKHEFTWTPEAEDKLKEVPEFCRELTRWRVEWTAAKKNLGNVITPEIMDVKYDMWGEVSQAIQSKPNEGKSMPWTNDAEERIAKIPEFVKGMVIQAVEGNARAWNFSEVNGEVLDRVIEKWVKTGDFHEGKFGFKP